MPLTRIQPDGLGANQTLSLVHALESSNIFPTAIGGNVNIDIANSTVYFFNANTTAGITFNLRANSLFTLDSALSVGQTVSVAIGVKHGTSAGRHAANLYIDGGLITTSSDFGATGNLISYAGNIRPAFSALTAGEINLFSYSVFKRAANSYIVLASNSTFGLG